MKSAKPRQRAKIRQAFFPQNGLQGGEQFALPPNPFLNQEGVAGLFSPQAALPSSPKKGLGNIFGLIDKIGGIDGVVDTFGKIQKMVGMFRQIQPMFKLIGSFAGKKVATQSLSKKHNRYQTQARGKRRSPKKTKRTSRR